jgi:iron complex transport system permease protein
MSRAVFSWPLWLTLLLAGVITALIAFASLAIGPGDSDLSSVWRVLSGNASSVERTVILDIRLPRILLGLVVGAALSGSGAVFQALLRNPLAEPYILGVSGGAAVGMILASLIGIVSMVLSMGFAFIVALAATGLVLVMARRRLRLNTHVMILAGVVLNTLFSAAIIFFLAASRDPQSQSVFFWLMGNLGRASLSTVLASMPVLLALLAVVVMFAHRLNLIYVGEETARQAGVSVDRDKWILFIVTSLATALSVSLAGIIGFVGLMLPHVARRLFGADHRRLLPISIITGAGFLVLSDSIARTVLTPIELPVGVVTAACGVPFFLWLLWREARVA